LNRHRVETQNRVGHLTGHRAFPDHLVQLVFSTGQPQFIGGLHFRSGRTNRFVRLLRAFGFGCELTGRRAEIIFAVKIIHFAARGGDRFAAEADAVGTHVSDVTVFVQSLSCLHRLPSSHAELSIRFLLQRTCCERRIGFASLLFLFNAGDGPRLRADFFQQCLRGYFFQQQNVGAIFQATGVFIEVTTSGDATSTQSLQHSFERLADFALQSGFQVPERAAAEFHAFDFASDQQSHGHALNSPRRKSASDLFPQQWAKRISVKPIDNASSFLSLDEVLIQQSRILDGFQNCRLSDFRKHHPADRNGRFQNLHKVPADTFPFTVFVGREDKFFDLFEAIFEFGDQFFLFCGNDIERIEVIFDVNSKCRPRFFFDCGRDLSSAGW
jgi:hypothetical protein